jgi:hypothetical protein
MWCLIVLTGTTTSVQADEDPKSFKGELRPYSSSLEYLDDAFQVLALMLRIAKARHKEEMKEAFNDERPWYDAYRTSKVGWIPLARILVKKLFPLEVLSRSAMYLWS